jgi:hypothetical protein
MMWVIVFAATKRPLHEDEARELRRLCGLFESGVTGREEFKQRAEDFCAEMFSCGVLENRRINELGDLLLGIDELRDMLK